MPGGQAGGYCLLMRRLFRWVFRLVVALIILAVVAVAAAVVLLDTLTREFLVSRLRSKTGMEVNIRAVHVGLLSPTVSIEGLQLRNRPEFGGALCLDMPELHIEYDAAALRARRLHITLLRLDLLDLSLLQDKNGRSNFDPPGKAGNHDSSARKNSVGRLQFTGIDVLNVTLGKFRLLNMASGNGEEIDFGIKNKILRNVKSEKDLAPLGLATFAHGKATSTGDSGVDLDKVLDSFLDTP